MEMPPADPEVTPLHSSPHRMRPTAPTAHAAPATVTAPSVADSADPMVIVHHIEAWMPEQVATFKLRGFIRDVGGEIIENAAGRILVRIGGRGSVYILPTRSFSWLGIGPSSLIDMELRLEHVDGGRDSQLHVTVTFRMPGQNLNVDAGWRRLCNQIFCDLRGYLMGQSGPVSSV